MRKSAITAAVLALSTISGVVIAEDDFSALLADLSFGDAPSLNAPETEPLTVVQKETLQDLMPVPGGMSMPETPNLDQSATTLTMPTIMEPAALKVVAVEKKAEIAPAPQVALMDPIPASVPPASEPLGAIDLDAAFALQEIPATPAKSVGHILHDNQCDNGDCQTNHFETGTYVRPRTPVRLPSSTLYQYFRSHPCYTNVWDGYGIQCGSYHKHLHGECDCFSGSGCGGTGKCDECAGH